MQCLPILCPVPLFLRNVCLRFRLAAEADLAPYISRVKDAALAHALSFGVGYVHETMPAIERQVVEFLFDSGAIQVSLTRI